MAETSLQTSGSKYISSALKCPSLEPLKGGYLYSSKREVVDIAIVVK